MDMESNLLPHGLFVVLAEVMPMILFPAVRQPGPQNLTEMSCWYSNMDVQNTQNATSSTYQILYLIDLVDISTPNISTFEYECIQ